MDKRYSIIVQGKEINITKEEYDRIMNSKSNPIFLDECKKAAEIFKKKVK